MSPNDPYGQYGQPYPDARYQPQQPLQPQQPVQPVYPATYPAYQPYGQYAGQGQGQYPPAPYGPPQAYTEPYYAQPAPQAAQPQPLMAASYPAAPPVYPGQPTYPAQVAEQPVYAFQPHDPHAWQRLSPDAAAGSNFPQPAIPYQPGAGRPAQARIFAGLAVLAVCIGIAGIITLAATRNDQRSSSSVVVDTGNGKLTPEQLFAAAIDTSLQTKSYTQQFKTADRQVERKVDVNDVKAPKLSGSVTITSRNTIADMYATEDDTFVKLVKSPLLNTQPTAQGTWVQVRKAGTVLDASGNGGATLDHLFTPTSAVYGSFIMGNYAATDRSAIKTIIEEQIVYRYDPTTVTQAAVGGRPVSEYEVTVSASGQQALAAQAATLAGVSQQRIAEASTVAQLAGNANSRIMVSVDNADRRIVQVRELAGDDPRTISYSRYGATRPAAMPQATATWNTLFP